TIFNLLGPLTNPAAARAQVVGVFAREWVEPVAEALRRLGCERALVVHGDDGLDEVTLTGPTTVAELRDGRVQTRSMQPQSLALQSYEREAFRGGDAHANAETVRNIVMRRATAAQSDIALLNAAAVIYVAGRAADLAEGLVLARHAVGTG